MASTPFFQKSLRTVLIVVSVLSFVRLECNAFSLSSSASTQQLTYNLQNSRSEQDASIENWYRSQHILGTSHISLCTSDKSVGGRGLFWVDNKNPPQRGDVLAYIPSTSLITRSNLMGKYPELNKMEELDFSLSWQATLTTYARYCLEYPKEDGMNREEWIKSWSGGGPGAPRPSTSYSMQELTTLSEITDAPIDLQVVKEVIDARYDTFTADLNDVKEFNEGVHAAQLFGELYSIILSRTASLGPEWQNQSGIIPFHDMINHPPIDHESNVELFCFGDVRKMIGYVHSNEMIKRLVAKADENGTSGDNTVLYRDPRDTDILLVASRDIEAGNELWLSYKNTKKEMKDEEKLWAMLQYGFPFHA